MGDTAPRGLIAPDWPLVARTLSGGRVEVCDLRRGEVVRAEGQLGRELTHVLEGGEATPALRALAELQPVVQALLSSPRRVPLAATTALSLGRFDLLFVELTGRCNERCVHCYAESSPEVHQELELGTVRAIVEDAAALGFTSVQLTGGDPLLHRHLLEVVRLVRDAGMAVEIYTNGLALKDELCAALAPHAPAFAFSFYSHDETRHDAITRSPGSQRRTLAAIERALGAGFAVRASVIVMDGNAADVEATVALLRGRGVDSVGVAGAYAVGRGDYFDGTLPHLTAEHRGGAEARSGTLCVRYTGDVVPCIFNRADVLGTVGTQRLRDIVAAPRLPAPEAAEGLLDRCERSLSCLECRTSAWALRAVAGAP